MTKYPELSLMMKTSGLRYVICLVISVSIILTIVVGCSTKPVVNIGDRAEDFILPSLSGNKIKLSNFKDQNILLFFWTVGCAFCQTDNVVYLNDIFLRGQKSGLTVLSVNIAGTKGEIVEFIKKKGLIFPVLMDRDASVARKKYGINMVPTMFIIDREGIILKIAMGFFDKKALWDFVTPHLSFFPSSHQSGQE